MDLFVVITSARLKFNTYCINVEKIFTPKQLTDALLIYLCYNKTQKCIALISYTSTKHTAQ